jgi:hypothetical protein
MLKRLKRWLGWDSDSSPFDFGDLRIPIRARPPAAKVAVNPPTAKTAAARASPPAPSDSTSAKPAKATPAQKPGSAEVLDNPKLLEILNNPKLTLDRPPDGFDPYNTGAFNRSTSWEKISRHKR